MRSREVRLAKAEAEIVPGAWYMAIPDDTQAAPGCWFLSNQIRELREEAGLEPLGDDALFGMTAAQVNAYARRTGQPEVPLEHVFEDARWGGGTYTMSRHYRPLSALGWYAFEMTLSEADKVRVDAWLRELAK